MRKWILYIFITAVSLLSCGRREDQSAMVSRADSVSRAMTPLLLHNDYAGATAMVDSADAAGLLSSFDAAMLRLRVMSRDEAQARRAIEECEKWLKDDGLTPHQ